MSVEDIYACDIHFRHQENDNLYCFIFQIQSEANEAVASRDVAVHGLNKVWPALRPIITTEAVGLCAVGREIWPATSIPEIQRIDENGSREIGLSTALPGQNSMVAQLFGDAGNPNRFNRGRDFLAAWNCQDQTRGMFDSDPLSDAQTFYEGDWKTFTATSGNQFRWGTFSLTQAKKTVPQNGNPPVDPDAVFFWPIELVRLNPLVRTQRRRQPEDPCRVYRTFDPNI